MQSHFFASLDPQQNIYDTRRIGLLWLIKLRWWAVAGQIITIAIGAFFFRLTLPLAAISVVIGIEVITNMALAGHLRAHHSPPARYLLPFTLYADIALLTSLLFITGGTMNPFTFLYLVHITLGAILLSGPAAWGLSSATILFYGMMFVPGLLQQESTTTSQEIMSVCTITNMNMNLHLQGMWFAYAVSAVLITFFASRIQQSLSEYHQTITTLRQEKEQNDKISALATLAAGAAHELSTPLATISVASGEILYSCQNNIHDDNLLEDARLIREQTRRCKDILFQMSAEAGAVQGEKHLATTIDALIKNALALLGTRPPRLTIDNQLADMTIQAPPHTVAWALKGLLANAVDATDPDNEIILECREEAEYICFTVIDHGCGMPSDVAKQAPEPFFTTKPVGKGMGLGLFLAKSLAAQLQGDLRINTSEGQGTSVTMSFKKSAITPASAEMEA
ncbi:MAG: hypothetical protein C0613_05220 [Desulfobulbaceae bacterium]|nr:MAG: hypothetical protein C0613_05220 [Desulfobulbaceae bacterium]